MKNTILKGSWIATMILFPLVSFAGGTEQISKGYWGDFVDQQSGVKITMDGGFFTSDKVVLKTSDGTKRDQKVKELKDIKSLSILTTPIDPRKKDKPLTPPAGAYAIENEQEKTSDIYLVTPLRGSVQKQEQGIIWYEADIAILPLSLGVSDKVAGFEALRCDKGIVMIDTLATDFASALEIACSETEVNLVLKRVK
jgi:hypothetical protein